MYKVFLADDEIVVREGIRSSFPWDDTEFTLAGEAPDGEIAMNMIQDIKPDVLITDIRMPFMDGLELCRALMPTMPWMHVIIISGYDDFAYAKEAMSLGVREYLLKPISGQELLEALRRMADLIEEEKRRQADLFAYRRQRDSYASIQREQQVQSLLQGIPGLSPASLPGLSSGCYLAMVLKIQSSAPDPDTLLQVRQSLEHLADSSGSRAWLCAVKEGFAFLAQGAEESALEEWAYGLAQAAQYETLRNTGLQMQVAIGTTVKRIQDIPLSCANARSVLEKLSARRKESCIMSMQDLMDAQNFSPVNLDIAPISELLRHAGVEDVDSILDSYINSLGDTLQSTLVANYVVADIMLAACRMVREAGGAPEKIIPQAMHHLSADLPAQLETMLPIAQDILKKAVCYRDTQGPGRYSTLIRKAKEYIMQNYANPDVTLRDVASHVALSNNHFCTVFSQEMGATFTEYLTATRMNRAKELLVTTTLRTGDIAQEVGYNDPHYFSYLFKKHVGLTPRDFRREAQEKKTGN